MKSQIRFGVIGCSSIAKKSAIPSIIHAKNSTLEMIGSRTDQKSKNKALLEPFLKFWWTYLFDSYVAIYLGFIKL